MSNNSNQIPLAAALGAVLLWSFAFPASKAALPFFSVEQIVLFRYAVACGFYFILFAFGKFPLPQVRDLPTLTVLGLLSVTVYQLLFVFGIGKVDAGAAAMIAAASPVFSSLLARAFLDEKMSRVAWSGIFLSIAGIAIISVIKGTDGELIGYLALVIAIFSISTYFVFQKPLFKRYSALSVTAYTSFAGTIPLLIFTPHTIAAISQAPMLPILWITTMGIFSSGIGFILWTYALSKLRAGIVTSFLFLQPVFVVVLSWAWLDEIPETKTFIGGGIVLLGVSFILIEQMKQSNHTNHS